MLRWEGWGRNRFWGVPIGHVILEMEESPAWWSAQRFLTGGGGSSSVLPGDIWQYLETFVIVTTAGGGVLLASSA